MMTTSVIIQIDPGTIWSGSWQPERDQLSLYVTPFAVDVDFDHPLITSLR
jgi:hypothetical protein